MTAFYPSRSQKEADPRVSAAAPENGSGRYSPPHGRRLRLPAHPHLRLGLQSGLAGLGSLVVGLLIANLVHGGTVLWLAVAAVLVVVTGMALGASSG